MAHLAERDTNEQLVKLSLLPQPVSFVRDPRTGSALLMRRYSVDAVKQSGEFDYEFERVGVREHGVLTGVDANRPISFDTVDPLRRYHGSSTVETLEGQRIYTKRQSGDNPITDNSTLIREYDFLNGLSMRLSSSDAKHLLWRGQAFDAGQVLAEVELQARLDASMVFTLRYASQPDVPVVLGYGLQTTEPELREPPPPTLLPIVVTMAGDVSPGYRDGPGESALFNVISGMVQSMVDPYKFYLTDMNNQCIRVVTIDKNVEKVHLQVSTLTGFPETSKRLQDGDLSVARFKSPVGIVNATAFGTTGLETLYVSDLEARVIRRIDVNPDGTGMVSTVAGSGASGNANGPGATATFQLPSGLAIDRVAKRLYVADFKSAKIRAIALDDPDYAVSDLAGSTEGYQDGAASVARFYGPRALICDDRNRRLLISDWFNHAVRILNLDPADAAVTTLLGGKAPDYPLGLDIPRLVDGPLAQSTFVQSYFLAVSRTGRLLFGNENIRTYDGTSKILRTLAGSWSGTEDGDVNDAEFMNVRALLQPTDYALLIADQHRLRWLTTSRDRKLFK